MGSPRVRLILVHPNSSSRGRGNSGSASRRHLCKRSCVLPPRPPHVLLFFLLPHIIVFFLVGHGHCYSLCLQLFLCPQLHLPLRRLCLRLCLCLRHKLRLRLRRGLYHLRRR